MGVVHMAGSTGREDSRTGKMENIRKIDENYGVHFVKWLHLLKYTRNMGETGGEKHTCGR